jgi:gamma-glutamylcyclotransferase (GGCT)/AIG2-like uncharacterized protein YtfP
MCSWSTIDAGTRSIFGMMASPIHYLFVYGTLRSDFRHKAHGYVARYFSLKGKASVQGKLYDAIEYPAGVPATGNNQVTGELYEIKNAEEFDQAMRVLDEYEGSYDAPGEPALFRRELVSVQYKDDEVKAWIYWYNRPVEGMKWIASGDILQSDF